jgi:hypothetical protein
MSAVSAARAKYAHRKNTDGTFDSICLTCFRTAGSTLTENGLLSHETHHVCRPADLWHAQHELRAKMMRALGVAV